MSGPFDDEYGSAPAWSLDGSTGSVEDALSGAASARYDLRAVLGQGGMGRVRVAWDKVLRREVALKEVLPVDAAQAARLQREAWITARLDHPGIIAVHDAGTLDDGRPFYTMRLVRGQTLAQRLEVAIPEGRQALLRAVLAVCEAVSAAHAAGIVHRDLKPANVLLGRFGEVQVVDWGLATPDPGAAGRWADEAPPLPESGPVGTPRWMSPEQARGADATVRSDVWSLGALLYAVLAGASPYPGDTQAQVAARKAGPPAPLPDTHPAELVAIVHRALAHDPSQRYPDAGALAADLARWFDGRRVEAFTYSTWDLLRRTAWTWRVPLVALLAALLVGLGGLAVFFVQLSAERDRALEAEADARRARRASEERLSEALVAQARAAVLDDDRDEAEAAATRALEVRDSPAAKGVLAAFGRAGRLQVTSRTPAPDCRWVMTAPDGSRFVCGTGHGYAVWRPGAEQPLWSSPETTAPGFFGYDGSFTVHTPTTDQWVVIDEDYRQTRIDGDAGGSWGPSQTWAPKVTRLGDGFYPADVPPDLPPGACSVRTMAPGPDHQQVALACENGDIYVGPLQDPLARRYPTLFKGKQEMSALAWSPSGMELAVGTIRGGYGVLDLETGFVRNTQLRDDGPSIQRMVVSPDGELVVIERQHGGIGIWGMQSGAWLGKLPAPSFASVGFADADTLVVIDDEIRRVDVSRLGPPTRLWFQSGIADLQAAPDGRQLVVALGNGIVEVLDARSGARLNVIHVGEHVVKAVQPVAGGALYIAQMDSPHVLRLEPGSGTPVPVPGLSALRRLSVLADGTLLAATIGYQFQELSPGAPAPRSLEMAGPFRDLESTPGGRGAIVLRRDTWIHRKLGVGQAWTEHEVAPRAHAAAMRDDGTSAVAWADRVVLYDIEMNPIRTLTAPAAGLRDLAFSPDGARLAATGLDGQVRLWRVADGTLLGEMTGHTDRVYTLAFGPDGDWLATGSWDHTVRIWDLTTFSG